MRSSPSASTVSALSHPQSLSAFAMSTSSAYYDYGPLNKDLERVTERAREDGPGGVSVMPICLPEGTSYVAYVYACLQKWRL